MLRSYFRLDACEGYLRFLRRLGVLGVRASLSCRVSATEVGTWRLGSNPKISSSRSQGLGFRV